MRTAAATLMQIVVAAVLIAALGGLIGAVIVYLAHWGGAATGFGWGMVVAGGFIAFVAGQSDSPSEDLARGWNYGPGGAPFYFGNSSPLPQTPLQIALGGMLVFAAGIGMFFLFAS